MEAVSKVPFAGLPLHHPDERISEGSLHELMRQAVSPRDSLKGTVPKYIRFPEGTDVIIRHVEEDFIDFNAQTNSPSSDKPKLINDIEQSKRKLKFVIDIADAERLRNQKQKVPDEWVENRVQETLHDAEGMLKHLDGLLNILAKPNEELQFTEKVQEEYLLKTYPEKKSVDFVIKSIRSNDCDRLIKILGSYRENYSKTGDLSPIRTYLKLNEIKGWLQESIKQDWESVPIDPDLIRAFLFLPPPNVRVLLRQEWCLPEVKILAAEQMIKIFKTLNSMGESVYVIINKDYEVRSLIERTTNIIIVKIGELCRKGVAGKPNLGDLGLDLHREFEAFKTRLLSIGNKP